MRYDHIAWDFNGTILDDVHSGVEATNILLRRRALPTIDSLDYYYSIFSFPIEKYYERLGFDFSRESYADIALEWVAEYRRLSAAAPAREGVIALMAAFAAKGIPQTVLSASEESLLLEQLCALGVRSYLEGVHGRSDHSGEDKTALVLSFRDRRKPGRTLFIGDTDHDAACARAAGFDCVLIAGGHQSRARLQACAVSVYDDIASLHRALREAGDL